MVQNFSDQGLVDAVITVTEAKSLALRNIGHSFAGTVTDAVAIATEGSGDVRYAGSATEIGQRIHATVFFGTQQALMRQTGVIQRKKPSFFIQSSMGGAHWIEWEKKNCPYYPCHFEGQRCDFCYCPLYPCGDTTLGDWIEKPGKASVWSCTRCTLNHDPRVTSHLKRNPEASLEELKALFLKI
jgi:adenosylcobinamide hydrolase